MKDHADTNQRAATNGDEQAHVNERARTHDEFMATCLKRMRANLSEPIKTARDDTINGSSALHIRL